MTFFTYGKYTSTINESRPKDAKCPDCNSINQIRIVSLVEYFHVFFIPIFPFRKENVIHCVSCGLEFSDRSLTAPQRKYWSNFLSKKHIPIWYFTGTICAIGILLYSQYSNFQNNNEMLSRVLANGHNQIIELELENGNYSTMKLIRKEGDTIFYYQNQLFVKDFRDIDKITSNANYSNEISKLSKDEFSEIFKAGRVKYVYEN